MIICHVSGGIGDFRRLMSLCLSFESLMLSACGRCNSNRGIGKALGQLDSKMKPNSIATHRG